MEWWDFEYGLLHIDKIHCSDLKNTELTAWVGGLPDPFAKFTLGEWEAETPEANNNIQRSSRDSEEWYNLYHHAVDTLLEDMRVNKVDSAL